MLPKNQNKIIKIDMFYKNHKDYFLNYANLILNDRTMSEDAVHDAFIKVIENKEEYATLKEEELVSLVTVIIRNLCFDFLRREKNFSKFIKEIGTNRQKILYKDKGFEKIEIMDQIKKLFIKLKEIDKKILIMKYYFGMTSKEIGQEFGMTTKNVDMHIYRAKQKVRNQIDYEKYFNNY